MARLIAGVGANAGSKYYSVIIFWTALGKDGQSNKRDYSLVRSGVHHLMIQRGSCSWSYRALRYLFNGSAHNAHKNLAQWGMYLFVEEGHDLYVRWVS